MTPNFTSRHILIVAVSLALSTWGLVGVLGGEGGSTEPLFETDYTIQHLPPKGSLEGAGFQVGDSVVSVEGIPVVELGMYSRWPKSLAREPGQALRMTVERDGEMVSGELVYGEASAGAVKLRFGALLVGLSFLWLGVWAFLSNPSIHSVHLLAMGLATGSALPGPSLGSWNGVRDHIQLAGMVLWTLFLLRFFLFFPRRKRVAGGHLPSILIFAPWVGLLGCLALELLFHPRFYHTFGPVHSLLMLAYTLLAMAAVVHTLVTTPQGELRASGMGIALGGIAVAAVGLTLWLLSTFLPFLRIPGSSWLPVLIGVIPLGLVLGVRQNAARELGADRRP